MNCSTLLPLLIGLGLIIFPELNSSSSSPCRKVCCTPRECPCDDSNPCLTGATVTPCSQNEVCLCGIRWKDSPCQTCDCQLCEEQGLVDSGFENWRTDPVAVATRFMQNCFIDDCFRGYPTYLAGKCTCADKTYVVLGVTCAGKMIFELCQPVKEGSDGIWEVTRYADYCN
ncbi:MAG: hypothetical protein IJ323_00895 [Clostridia bacterium]|nr:hypothetical protein [Clostridia bacterium]